MINYNERIFRTDTPEYDRNFWDTMRGSLTAEDDIHCGLNRATGAFVLPSGTNDRYEKAIKRESIFRNIATVVKAYNGGGRIFAKDCDDIAAWVPEGEMIPIYNAVDDFTQHPVDMHKLAVFVKLDDDFIHDASFNIRSYLTDRLARNFARTEDIGFVTGTGVKMPTGILCPDKGAEVALTVESIGFDDVIRLFFSLAVWG